MRQVINVAVDMLLSHGYDAGQIGAAMTGIGLALTVGYHGNDAAIRNLDAVRDALSSSAQRLN